MQNERTNKLTSKAAEGPRNDEQGQFNNGRSRFEADCSKSVRRTGKESVEDNQPRGVERVPEGKNSEARRCDDGSLQLSQLAATGPESTAAPASTSSNNAASTSAGKGDRLASRQNTISEEKSKEKSEEEEFEATIESSPRTPTKRRRETQQRQAEDFDELERLQLNGSTSPASGCREAPQAKVFQRSVGGIYNTRSKTKHAFEEADSGRGEDRGNNFIYSKTPPNFKSSNIANSGIQTSNTSNHWSLTTELISNESVLGRNLLRLPGGTENEGIAPRHGLPNDRSRVDEQGYSAQSSSLPSWLLSDTTAGSIIGTTTCGATASLGSSSPAASKNFQDPRALTTVEEEYILGQTTLRTAEGGPHLDLGQWLDIQLQSATGRQQLQRRLSSPAEPNRHLNTTTGIRPGCGRPNDGISHLIGDRSRSSPGRPRTTRAVTSSSTARPTTLPGPLPAAVTNDVVDQALLLKLLSNPEVRSLKTIPKFLRREVAIIQSNIMQRIINKPSDERAWIDWFIFPRITLVAMPASEHYKLRRKKRNKAQAQFTKSRLDLWKEGEESYLPLINALLNSTPQQRQQKSPSNSSNKRRCSKLAREDGQFSKALQTLRSHGVADSGPETTSILQGKHPPGGPIQARLVRPEECLEVNAATVMVMLQSFPKGTACGRSGQRASHLMECAASGIGVPQFLESLTAVVNICLSGQAPLGLAHIISSAPLTPLLKKDNSIRPIAVGEILRRLVSKCCMHAVRQEAATYLAPLQMGVGISNGVEGILHALNYVIKKHDLPPDTVLLLVDFENAFNKVDRQYVIDQAWEHFPQIAAWVQYTYGTAASLFAGKDILKASAGIQQGDPLGPLLFALVLQLLLKKLKELGVDLTSFLDDLTIVAPAAKARECLDILITEGPSYGLTVSLTKTVVWWPRPVVGSTLQAPAGSQIGYDLFPTIVRSSADGVKLLGGAVSLTDSFFEIVAAERVRKAIESIEIMMELDDPQLCLMLLRACEGMKKLNYCWRTIDPRILRGLAAVMDNATINALRRICVADGPGFGDFQAMLASLPVTDCGGLGVSLASDISKFAYVASNLSSLAIQQTMFPSLPPAPTEVVSSLLDSFQADTSLDAVQSADLQNQVKLPHNKLQNYMAKLYYGKKRRDLLQHTYLTDMHEDLRNRTNAVLQSVLEPIASQWLFALPNAGLSQYMNSNEFRAAISIRLLIPLFAYSFDCRAKGCKECVMDKFGYHALSCRGAGNLCKARHDLVRDALFDISLQGNFNPVKDAPVQCMGLDTSTLRGHLYRPADLLIRGNDFDRDCIDVTVSSPISKDMCLPANFVAGLSARQAEDGKFRKHLEACEQANYGFYPFAMDVFGVVGPQSTDLIKRFCHSYQAAKGLSKSLAYLICLRRISFSVQLGVARQLVPLLSSFPD